MNLNRNDFFSLDFERYEVLWHNKGNHFLAIFFFSSFQYKSILISKFQVLHKELSIVWQCIVALSKVDGMSNSPTFSYITFTARKYPFYLFQWHPAKPQFEWSRVKDIKHTQEAILAGQYWANFFVNQGNSLCNFTASIIHKKRLLGPELSFIWLIWLKRTKHFTIDHLTNISI